jgi:hypothetical protein
MATDVEGAHIPVFKDILNLLKVRYQKRPVTKARRLVFWDDGMLKELKAIAAGDADIETTKKLRRKFEESERKVKGAIRKLLRIRDKLGPTRGRATDRCRSK